MGELAVRAIIVLVENGFEYVGYCTARVLIPLVTFGRCKVAEPDSAFDMWSQSKDDGIQPATAALIGIVFWLFVAAAIFLLVR